MKKEKTCTKCLQTKPKSEFYPERADCKKCVREKQNEAKKAKINNTPKHIYNPQRDLAYIFPD